MKRLFSVFVIFTALAALMALASCQRKEIIREVPVPVVQPVPQVVKQVVPVSSVPIGAQVYADGILIGVTPIAVDFERNRNHLITVAKEGYIAQNIAILCKRDPAKSLERAFTSVLENSGPKDDPMKAAAKSYRQEEITGEAFLFEPSIVSVELQAEKK